MRLSLLVLVGIAAARPRDELWDAIFYGHVEGVNSLLTTMKSEVFRAGHAPIDVNRLDGEHNRTSIMICGMYDPDDAMEDRTPAVDKSCREIASLLLKEGVDLLHRDKYGWSVLHHAAVRGFAQMVGLLIDDGKVPLDELDNEGFTALMRAAGGGWLDTVKVLLESGASFRLGDTKGRSALHLIVQMAVLDSRYVSYLKRVAALLPKAALELIDDNGRTPLHYALIGKGSPEAAEALLEAGADSRSRDAFGVSSYHMAGSERTRSLVAEYNARSSEMDILKARKRRKEDSESMSRREF